MPKDTRTCVCMCVLAPSNPLVLSPTLLRGKKDSIKNVTSLSPSLFFLSSLPLSVLVFLCVDLAESKYLYVCGCLSLCVYTCLYADWKKKPKTQQHIYGPVCCLILLAALGVFRDHSCCLRTFIRIPLPKGLQHLTAYQCLCLLIKYLHSQIK